MLVHGPAAGVTHAHKRRQIMNVLTEITVSFMNT